MKSTHSIALHFCLSGLFLAAACGAPVSRQSPAGADSVMRAQYAATGAAAGMSGEEAAGLLAAYRKAAGKSGSGTAPRRVDTGMALPDGWADTQP